MYVSALFIFNSFHNAYIILNDAIIRDANLETDHTLWIRDGEAMVIAHFIQSSYSIYCPTLLPLYILTNKTKGGGGNLITMIHAIQKTLQTLITIIPFTRGLD